MNQIIKIVKGRNLKELIENAIEKSKYNIESFNILEYSLVEEKQTIVEGEIDIKYWNRMGDYFEETKSFEVNIGRHKDELVIFDEFEVIIE
jgi:capsid portal protein